MKSSAICDRPLGLPRRRQAASLRQTALDSAAERPPRDAVHPRPDAGEAAAQGPPLHARNSTRVGSHFRIFAAKNAFSLLNLCQLWQTLPLWQRRLLPYSQKAEKRTSSRSSRSSARRLKRGARRSQERATHALPQFEHTLFCNVFTTFRFFLLSEYEA